MGDVLTSEILSLLFAEIGAVTGEVVADCVVAVANGIGADEVAAGDGDCFKGDEVTFVAVLSVARRNCAI